MISDETKEELHKRELIDELINKLRDAVSTGDTIYLLEKFVAVLNMHEQQKQRADELEKRWSELRERLNTSFENSEYFLEGFGFSDVLKLMQQLEEDNNARSK